MASITKHTAKDGTLSYKTQIRIKKQGKIVYQETRTFSRQSLAQAWARRREVELEQPGEIEKARTGDVTVGALILRYIEEFSKLAQWQRSKQYTLMFLTKQDIADADPTALTTQTFVDYARRRRLGGASAATVGNDMAWLRVVLKTARGAWGIAVDLSEIEAAFITCRQLKLIGRPKRRQRRPTPIELEALDKWFRRPAKYRMPMADIMWFAIHSARRESEITRIEWADNKASDLTGMVRDEKHPRHKIGNHRTFKYTQAGWDIVQRQPKHPSGFIFPYHPDSISANFTRACKMLGIVDLRFHDLRHEGTSRLFEAGYQIHEVAQFTLHEDWKELKRYTQLRPGDLKLRPAI